MRTSARRRDRGVQAERGFAGDPAARSRNRFAEAEEAGAEAPWSTPRGRAPKPGDRPDGPRLRPSRPRARDRHPHGPGPSGPGGRKAVEPGPEDAPQPVADPGARLYRPGQD